MLSRRTLLAVLAVAPVAACSKEAAGTPAASGGATGSTGVTVYVPGAMAAHTKTLAAAAKKEGLNVTFEVGHTPIQREQLIKGATPDAWIAANPDDMAAVAAKGLVDKTGVKQLARTKLVIVVAPDNPGGVQGVADLAKPGLKLLVGAETLPIWKTTQKALAKMEAKQGAGFTKKVMANVVSKEMGVAPIVSKVGMGEADAGIVFVTDVTQDAKVTTAEVPDDVNQMLPLSIAVVNAGKNKTGGENFVTFMTEGAGKQVLSDAGYLPPAAS